MGQKDRGCNPCRQCLSWTLGHSGSKSQTGLPASLLPRKAISLYDKNKSQLRESGREEPRKGREKTDTREIGGPTASGM